MLTHLNRVLKTRTDKPPRHRCAAAGAISVSFHMESSQSRNMAGFCQFHPAQRIRYEKIGNATLYCGDCLDVLPLIDTAGSLLTDPPYSSGGLYRSDRTQLTGAKYLGTKTGKLPHFGGDNRDQRSYLTWTTMWMRECLRIMPVGALACVFTDWRQLPVMTDAYQAAGFVWRGVGVWDKTESVRPVLGRFRNQCEYFVWGTQGQRPTTGSVAPGVYRGRVTTERKFHQTAKPTEMLGRMLSICDGPVLDPFMGSGSTGVACAQAGLPFIGIEANLHYFQTACERIEEAQRGN